MNKIKLFKLSILFVLLSAFTISCGSSRVNESISDHSNFVKMSKSENQVVISLDTVFFKGEPYAVMKKEGFSIASILTFYSLTGEKVITVLPYSSGDNNSTSHHEYSFHGTSSGMKAYLPFSFKTISICENIVNNALLNTTGLRAIDVGNFVKNNPRPPKFNPAILKIKREMAKSIKINQGYGEIYQGEVKIGIFTQGTRKSEDLKKSTAVFIVKFLNQTKCAEITFEDGKFERDQNPTMSINTEFDGKNAFLTIDENNRTFDIDTFKQAVEFLVKNGYL